MEDSDIKIKALAIASEEDTQIAKQHMKTHQHHSNHQGTNASRSEGAPRTY